MSRTYTATIPISLLAGIRHSLTLLRSAITATHGLRTQAGAANAQCGHLDALVVLDPADEITGAALAVSVLVGEPGVKDRVGPDGLDVVRQGRVARAEAVVDLLVDFVLAMT